jgi:hypothetical protein
MEERMVQRLVHSQTTVRVPVKELLDEVSEAGHNGVALGGGRRANDVLLEEKGEGGDETSKGGSRGRGKSEGVKRKCASE